MATAPRGRGYALSLNKNSARPLRKPGEAGLIQRFGNDLSGENSEQKKEDKFAQLCDKICRMTLNDPKKEFATNGIDGTFLTNSTESLQNIVDKIFSFGLRSKWNAHAMIVFSEYYIDNSVEGTKLRAPLLRKLQSFYLERNKTYLILEKFLTEVTLACEIFHHIKIDNNPIQVLAHPVLDYLSMLVDGGSQKEIEVVQEQLPKCFKDLKANDPDGFETFSIKIRKQLIETGMVTVRTALLEIFEMILTDYKPSSGEVKKFYDSSLKPVSRICEK